MSSPALGQDAEELARLAENAERGRLYDVCVEKDRASLELEEKSTTRVHLAGCQDRAGHVLDALQSMQAVLEGALRADDAEVAELARLRVEQLLAKLAHARLQLPDVDAPIELRLDGHPVALEAAAKSLTLDPGDHRVEAKATVSGTLLTSEQVVNTPSGVVTDVRIVLRPSETSPNYLPRETLVCMQNAKSQDEVTRCLPEALRPFVARASLEMSAYADTLDVTVLSPAVRASVRSPTSGWSASAGYVVDVVSAASPDMVSTASKRGHDTRHAVTGSLGFKPKTVGAEFSGAFSTESDYVARNGSVALLADFAEKRVTPRLSYSFGRDSIGRGGTPFSVYLHELEVHEAALSMSLVLSPKTVLVVGGSGGFESGDSSKPYRLIPMFAPGVDVPRGASTDTVNALRLPVRPYEQLPLERDRYALAGRLATRVGDSATLRLEERLYRDSWAIMASSTDARFLVDAGSRFRVGPHVRGHVQTGSVFYHRVYHAETSPLVAVPLLRTTDRELGPLVSLTGGLSARCLMSSPTAAVRFAIALSGDVMRSWYLDSLYVRDRTAYYGTTALEVEFE